MVILILFLLSNPARADSVVPCPPSESSQNTVVSTITNARTATAQFADPDVCQSSDLSAFCSEKVNWMNGVVYSKTQNPSACQKYGDKNIFDITEEINPDCAKALKDKFTTEVMPWIQKTYDKILNHSDYIQHCCEGDQSCSKKMHSIPIKFFPDRYGTTGYDEKIAPGAIAIGYTDASSFDPEIEKATLMHELGHACHETLVPVPYESDVPRAKAMEKLISDRFGKDFLDCIQQEFGKYYPDWKNTKNYGSGINRLYNEAFTESLIAPIAPKSYQGFSCTDQGKISYYYPAMACRWKIQRLKKQWCQ